jgi:hypothetical protein
MTCASPSLHPLRERASGKPGTVFTPAERAYIRSELDRYFTTFPTVAEGLMPRTWKTGPRAGQPKLGPAAQSLLDRGFVSLDPHGRPPRLFFTATGLTALPAMMRDRRLADPEKFAYIRMELGIDPPKEAKVVE